MLQNTIKNLPNKLTLIRIGAIPILLLLYPFDVYMLNIFCAFLFAVAAITDYFDGYIARKYNAETGIGALLDPMADKMLYASVLVLITAAHNIPVGLAGLLLCRDIGISGLRLVALEKGIHIKVSAMGKWKTCIQGSALFCLMINTEFGQIPMRDVGMACAWVSLILSYWSAYRYIQGFWHKVKSEEAAEIV